MAIFGQRENLMVFLGLDGVQRLGLFRWLLVAMAIFLTVVPGSIFSLAQDRNRNLAFTAIISPDDGQMSPGIVLTPRLTLSGDFVCVMCAWIIALFGSFSLMRRNNCVGQFISAFLILFTLLQTLTALYNVLFSNQWIFKIMAGSWKKAYDLDIDLVKEIEYEFSCKGYYSPVVDRSGEGLEGCSKILIQRFGPQLFYIAKIVLFSRLAQLGGVLAHTFIFNCITLHDIQQYICGGEDLVRSNERDFHARDRETAFRQINTCSEL